MHQNCVDCTTFLTRNSPGLFSELVIKLIFIIVEQGGVSAFYCLSTLLFSHGLPFLLPKGLHSVIHQFGPDCHVFIPYQMFLFDVGFLFTTTHCMTNLLVTPWLAPHLQQIISVPVFFLLFACLIPKFLLNTSLCFIQQL